MLLRGARTVIFVISILLLASGCASLSSPEQRRSSITLEQKLAVDRFRSCIDRTLDDQPKPTVEAVRLIRQNCDGHRRDVLATFPRHLEKQVNTLLLNKIEQSLTDTLSLDPNSGKAALVVNALVR